MESWTVPCSPASPCHGCRPDSWHHTEVAGGAGSKSRLCSLALDDGGSVNWLREAGATAVLRAAQIEAKRARRQAVICVGSNHDDTWSEVNVVTVQEEALQFLRRTDIRLNNYNNCDRG